MKVERTLLIVGMASLWPLLRGPYFATFFGAAGFESLQCSFNVMAAICAALMGLAACRVLRTGRTVLNGVTARGVLISGVVASFALLAWALAGAPMPGVLVAMIAAVAFAALACAWARASLEGPYTCDESLLSLDVVVSYLASYVLEMPIAVLGDAWTAALALLPGISALAWYMFARRVEMADNAVAVHADLTVRAAAEQLVGHVSRQLRGFIGVVAVLMVVSAVLAGLYSDAPVGGYALSCLLALPLAPCLLFANRRPLLRAVAWGLALLPIIMSALFVMAFNTSLTMVGVDILTMGRRTVWVLYWLILLRVARGAAWPAGSAVSLVGVLLVPLYAITRLIIDGLRTVGAARLLPPEALPMVTLLVAFVLMVCALVIVGMMVANIVTSALESSPDFGKECSDGALAGLDSGLRHTVCLGLACDACLTERETVILEYVSMGYTVPRIAEEENVSENTVRTHTKGLYRKLDIHTKQEIIELVNDRMNWPK